MVKYIRIVKVLNNETEIQKFFDSEITAKGLTIIHYNEEIISVHDLKITVVCSK